jgi:hypothetical protein
MSVVVPVMCVVRNKLALYIEDILPANNAILVSTAARLCVYAPILDPIGGSSKVIIILPRRVVLRESESNEQEATSKQERWHIVLTQLISLWIRIDQSRQPNQCAG